MDKNNKKNPGTRQVDTSIKHKNCILVSLNTYNFSPKIFAKNVRKYILEQMLKKYF